MDGKIKDGNVIHPAISHSVYRQPVEEPRRGKRPEHESHPADAGGLFLPHHRPQQAFNDPLERIPAQNEERLPERLMPPPSPEVGQTRGEPWMIKERRPTFRVVSEQTNTKQLEHCIAHFEPGDNGEAHEECNARRHSVFDHKCAESRVRFDEPGDDGVLRKEGGRGGHEEEGASLMYAEGWE